MLTLIDATGARFDGLSCELSMPVRGAWTARVELGERLPAAGPITLELARDGAAGVDSFAGTLRYGGEWQGRSQGQIVGGAGGLLTEIPAKHYAPKGHRIDARVLVEDIVREAGEEIDASADLGAHKVGQWTRVAAPPGRSLSLLCDTLGLQWRVLDSGRIWVGEDVGAEAGPADVGYLSTERPEARAVDVRPDRATLRPGMTVGGRPVTRVVYRLTAGGVSASAYYGRSDAREIGDAVASMLPDPAYAHAYGAKVVTQADDGTLEVAVDDDRVATLRRIPLRGMAGVRTLVRPGDRVRVAFENGKPDGAYAFAADAPDAQAAHRGIARKNDTVRVRAKVVGGALMAAAAHDPDGVDLDGEITGASEEAFSR